MLPNKLRTDSIIHEPQSSSTNIHDIFGRLINAIEDDFETYDEFMECQEPEIRRRIQKY